MPIDSPALAKRYDREAEAYRELWAPVLRPAGLRLLDELAASGARRIVDCGAGVGALLAEAQARFPGALVAAVDRSPGMLSLAPAEFPRAVMDAAELALASDSVDLTLYAFMLFHVDSPLGALSEARRVLRRGGRVGTLTWGAELESRATRIWTECLDTHGAPVVDLSHVRHESVDAPPKLTALFEHAGFRSIRTWEEDLACTIDADRVLRLRTSLGSPKTRFDGLDAQSRERCLAEARRRMTTLEPADFLARGRVVYGVATA